MNTVDNAPTTKTEPITYAVNSQALSRLKTKTVSVSKNKNKSKYKVTKRKRIT